MFEQVLDPVNGSLGLSALCAVLPLLTLFVLLGVLKMKAWQAGLISLVVSIVVAVVFFDMPVGQSGFEPAAVANCVSPASAMRAGSTSITARRSALSIWCQRAISGSVRPQPKQRLVLGSIIQTAMHGVSLLIEG